MTDVQSKIYLIANLLIRKVPKDIVFICLKYRYYNKKLRKYRLFIKPV